MTRVVLFALLLATPLWARNVDLYSPGALACSPKMARETNIPPH